MDIVGSTVLIYSWLKFVDKLLFTKNACRLYECAESSTGHIRTQSTSVHGKGNWLFWIDNIDIRCLYTCSYIHCEQ